MPINLGDLRAAVKDYLDTKVTVLISRFVPLVGDEINPNEEFKFTVSVSNPNALSGGLPLKNVRYLIWLDNPQTAKLMVPSGRIEATQFSGFIPLPPLPPIVLTPGSLVSNMALRPTDEKNYLSCGETEVINLKGKAGSAAGSSFCHVMFKIIAEVDRDYLFPINEDSPMVTKTLQVSG